MDTFACSFWGIRDTLRYSLRGGESYKFDSTSSTRVYKQTTPNQNGLVPSSIFVWRLRILEDDTGGTTGEDSSILKRGGCEMRVDSLPSMLNQQTEQFFLTGHCKTSILSLSWNTESLEYEKEGVVWRWRTESFADALNPNLELNGFCFAKWNRFGHSENFSVIESIWFNRKSRLSSVELSAWKNPNGNFWEVTWKRNKLGGVSWVSWDTSTGGSGGNSTKIPNGNLNLTQKHGTSSVGVSWDTSTRKGESETYHKKSSRISMMNSLSFKQSLIKHTKPKFRNEKPLSPVHISQWKIGLGGKKK